MIEKLKDIEAMPENKMELVINKRLYNKNSKKNRTIVKRSYAHIPDKKRVYAIYYRRDKKLFYNIDADCTACKFYILF